jgi:hypothetical protein
VIGELFAGLLAKRRANVKQSSGQLRSASSLP